MSRVRARDGYSHADAPGPTAFEPRRFADRRSASPRQAPLQRSQQLPSETGIALAARDQIGHHVSTAPLCRSAWISRPRGCQPEEPRLEPRRARELGGDFVAHARAYCDASPAMRRVGRPLAGRQREVDPFARDRIDEPGGVADHTPVRSRPARDAGGVRRQGTEWATSTARAGRRRRSVSSRIQAAARSRNVAGRRSRVGLCADADREVGRAGETTRCIRADRSSAR